MDACGDNCLAGGRVYDGNGDHCMPCFRPCRTTMSNPAIEPDQREAALGPPRFTLRALLAAMTLVGCLFGLMSAVGSVWSLVILLFAGLVCAHVLGNSL